ncbi:hypothetical protein [Thauera humireducens]|uniref:Uncharacterized protein n=1 Tax=Thauera humireducens TaxID=1134435 RepID=A0A127K374_9RHOO|nr:hypothetical protein [Thauera humireducens]AMO36405.1 hypothetical protein AC731_005320 [Thauera humireducens]
MSRLQNHNWIGFNGEPITGRVPPRLIVYGPDLTGQQRGEVFHAYKLFTEACGVAIGDYHIRNRVLSDGSRVRCASFMGQDVVEVWTRGVGEEKMLGGFICRPTSGVGDGGAWQYEGPARWWGKPFTPENRPLGTLYGGSPHVALRPHWKEGKPQSRYRVEKGVDLLYGTVDWQGRNPETDVLSWDAKTYNYTYFYVLSGTIEFFFDRWFQFGTSGMFGENFTDTTKSAGFVRRSLNRGSGVNVYNNGSILATISGGNVDGVAFARVGDKKLLVGAQRSAAFTSTGGQFNFFAYDLDSGVKTTIGAFRPAETWANFHGWYFNLDGRKARSICYEVSYEPRITARIAAYEVEILGDAVDDLTVAVREISPPIPSVLIAADFRRSDSLGADEGVLAVRPSDSNQHHIKVVNDVGEVRFSIPKPFSIGFRDEVSGPTVVTSNTYYPGTPSYVAELAQPRTGGFTGGWVADFDARYDACCLYEDVCPERVQTAREEGTLSAGNYSVAVNDTTDASLHTNMVTIGRCGAAITATAPWDYGDPITRFLTLTPEEVVARYG